MPGAKNVNEFGMFQPVERICSQANRPWKPGIPNVKTVIAILGRLTVSRGAVRSVETRALLCLPNGIDHPLVEPLPIQGRILQIDAELCRGRREPLGQPVRPGCGLPSIARRVDNVVLNPPIQECLSLGHFDEPCPDRGGFAPAQA